MTDRQELPPEFVERLRKLAESYLTTDDPYLQSGFGGGARRWYAERQPILEPVTRDGDLLDIGCANGMLLESLVSWASERGIQLTPHGLDQSAELVALARARFPRLGHNFFVGNAWSWVPPRRFRYVYSLADVVPPDLLRAYVSRVASQFVVPGGSLILGSYGSASRRIAPLDLEELLSGFGYRVAGTASAGGGPLVRFAWLEGPAA